MPSNWHSAEEHDTTGVSEGKGVLAICSLLTGDCLYQHSADQFLH